MQYESKKLKKSYRKPQFSVYGSVDTFTLSNQGAGAGDNVNMTNNMS